MRDDWRTFVTGHCRIETTLEIAVLYVGQPDGLPWARAADQFLDGRFNRIEGADHG